MRTSFCLPFFRLELAMSSKENEKSKPVKFNPDAPAAEPSTSEPKKSAISQVFHDFYGNFLARENQPHEQVPTEILQLHWYDKTRLEFIKSRLNYTIGFYCNLADYLRNFDRYYDPNRRFTYESRYSYFNEGIRHYEILEAGEDTTPGSAYMNWYYQFGKKYYPEYPGGVLNTRDNLPAVFLFAGWLAAHPFMIRSFKKLEKMKKNRQVDSTKIDVSKA